MTYQPDFPAALRPTAQALLRVLSDGEPWPAYQGPECLVHGEVLAMPYRVYYESSRLREVIAHSTGDTRALAQSLGTRHWDGYVREECLRPLLGLDKPWVVPFVVQLLGEYVIEIVEVIAAAIPALDAGRFAAFALENQRFMATIRRRATSYWDCYYRRRYPTLQNYPAVALLDAIDTAVRAGAWPATVKVEP